MPPGINSHQAAVFFLIGCIPRRLAPRVTAPAARADVGARARLGARLAAAVADVADVTGRGLARPAIDR